MAQVAEHVHHLAGQRLLSGGRGLVRGNRPVVMGVLVRRLMPLLCPYHSHPSTNFELQSSTFSHRTRRLTPAPTPPPTATSPRQATRSSAGRHSSRSPQAPSHPSPPRP